MPARSRALYALAVGLAFPALRPLPAFGGIDRFLPRQGGTTEIWRITHDVTMRDWADYHNVNCWSPDGRYIGYEHYEPYGGEAAGEVHIYDLHEDKDVAVEAGSHARWANRHNWLFYTRRPPAGEPGGDRRRQVMWLDIDASRRVRVATGPTMIGSVSGDDRWLLGANRRAGLRVAVGAGSVPIPIEGATGIQWIANPVHPVVFWREDHRDASGNDLPFAPTRLWCDLEGHNIVTASPMLQRCHQSWSGDGTYHLHGGQPMSGRRWNEPFPSNLHFLSVIGCGDVSPCGRSGRWICGSSNWGALQIADLWSGDGYNYLDHALSWIHDSDSYSYCAGSALEDNDSKGSPDGTKIAFVTNYDLKDGPITRVTETLPGASRERLVVESTDGFPASGSLSVRHEVVGYASKTTTTFERLVRGLHGTTPWQFENLTRERSRQFRERPPDIGKGTLITSFDARCIPQPLRADRPLPRKFRSERFKGDPNSPLVWQTRTDLHAAVVRRPDPPHLRMAGETAELIPGENHRETFGYHIFRDGNRITASALRPGAVLTLPGAAAYTACAVEWSGLESEPSAPLMVAARTELRTLHEQPAGFSWTRDRWLVSGTEVSEQAARQADAAVREIVHRVEGVLHREWYERGVIVRRHDLGREKKAVRRLFYESGRLARREYHTVSGEHASTELFDADGYITEAILYRTQNGQRREYSHIWYRAGMPVKLVGRGGRSESPRGPGTYEKDGETWVKRD
ncbi:MAG: hypothetical protein JXR37_31580 [Kiritimatiellae bacterium]|nr:hypothetical protein [Kiritimatiellia bacterium]